MAFALTEYDQELVRRTSIQVIAAPVSGFNFRGGNIPVQFPPVIGSDSKTAQWSVQFSYPYAWEPVALMPTFDTRKVNLKLKYVCTNHAFNGVVWNTENISNIVKDIRSYFMTTLLKGAGESVSLMPVFGINFAAHLPGEQDGILTFRGTNCTETPSDSYITIDNVTYAFSTEVTISLELVTRIQKEDGVIYQNFPHLKNRPPAKWY